MKAIWIIAVTAILFLTSLSSVFAQHWKVYPYHKEGTLIYFPKDEGVHPQYGPGSGTEWWYTNLHLKGETTNRQYSAMVAFFNYHFRIFNLTNETDLDFYSVLDLGSLSASGDSLNLSFVSPRGTDRWFVKTDANDQMLPFQYYLEVGDETAKLSVHLDAQKVPLIVGLDGLVTWGSGDSYYYSQTDLSVSGNVTFKGVTEHVTGVASIDHQYGPFFLSPLSEESYEWFNLQLDNGMDLILWNMFTGDNDIPMGDSHRMCTLLIDDQNQDTTSTFTLERQAYWKYRPESYFANKWHFADAIHGIDLTIEPILDNQVVPFILDTYFWEGSCSVHGTVDGDSVSGTAFAELLHIYRDPSITVVTPNGGEAWDGEEAVAWRLNNPDDGNPLTYDVSYSADSGNSFMPIVAGIIDTSYLWDVSGLTPGDGYLLKIVGYSIDSTVVGIDYSDTTFSIVLPTAVSEARPLEETSYELLQNYPNPFNPETKILFQLPEASQVVMKVYNTRGQEIRLLVDAQYEAGFHSLRWDGRDNYGISVTSGIYLYRIQAGSFSQARKVTLLR
jgi:predicted secreted hydrolase